jgi:ribosome-associated translation inhibitor RaiA
MKESILTRHEDIKKELTPKIEVLEKYFESISNEAHTMNEDAINSLKAMKDFNIKTQQDILHVSGKINGIYRKVGEFN